MSSLTAISLAAVAIALSANTAHSVPISHESSLINPILVVLVAVVITFAIIVTVVLACYAPQLFEEMRRKRKERKERLEQKRMQKIIKDLDNQLKQESAALKRKYLF